jgi:hypothetical protein
MMDDLEEDLVVPEGWSEDAIAPNVVAGTREAKEIMSALEVPEQKGMTEKQKKILEEKKKLEEEGIAIEQDTKKPKDPDDIYKPQTEIPDEFKDMDELDPKALGEAIAKKRAAEEAEASALILQVAEEKAKKEAAKAEKKAAREAERAKKKKSKKGIKGEDEEEEISLGLEDGSSNETSEEHGKPIEAAGATLDSGETKENNGGGASLVSAASSAVAAAVAALGSVDSGSSGEKKKEENAVPMGPSAWPGFMAVASEDTLTTESVQIQQYIRYICPIYFSVHAKYFLWNLSIEDGATRGYENNGVLFSFLKSVIFYETNQFNFR